MRRIEPCRGTSTRPPAILFSISSGHQSGAATQCETCAITSPNCAVSARQQLPSAHALRRPFIANVLIRCEKFYNARHRRLFFIATHAAPALADQLAARIEPQVIVYRSGRSITACPVCQRAVRSAPVDALTAHQQLDRKAVRKVSLPVECVHTGAIKASLRHF